MIKHGNRMNCLLKTLASVLCTAAIAGPAAAWDSQCPTTEGAARIELTTDLDGWPEDVFPYLSDADKISWLGPFRVTQEGDDPDEPYGVGSVRVVGATCAPLVEEQVFHYDFPNKLNYGVTRSLAYKNHCGVMELTRLESEDRLGTQLRWTITFDVKAGNSLPITKSFTHSYLNGRLRALKKKIENEVEAPTLADVKDLSDK